MAPNGSGVAVNIQLVSARSADRAALENLMQLYVHDFSEHWAGRTDGELDDDGRFSGYPLDAYWREPAHMAFLIRAEGKLAGFVLINDVSHTGRPVDRNLAEFFVVRKHRRAGVGTLAAHQIFSRYPGNWEAAVARRNVAALVFWRRAIRQHPLVTDIDENDIATPAWNGPVIRFRVRAPN
jgi:predicted acetyltransferase